MDLRTLQGLGGWSQIRILERYGHVSLNRKAEAVEGLTRKKFPYTIPYTGETGKRRDTITA